MTADSTFLALIASALLQPSVRSMSSLSRMSHSILSEKPVWSSALFQTLWFSLVFAMMPELSGYEHGSWLYLREAYTGRAVP